MANSPYDFAIVGAGWLGLALTKELMENQKAVVATCRTKDKVNQLNAEGVKALQYRLGDKLDTEYLVPLFAANTLILNIAPGRMKDDIPYFIRCMKNLIETFMQTPREGGVIPNVLFISTSSVYGERVREVIETSEVEPATVSAKAHVELEQYLQSQYPTQATILRLAGLIGADRHPVRHLVKKSPLGSPNKRVNLIDRVDVIRVIQAICEQNSWGEIMHLSSHEHPSRQAYYNWAAEQLGLEELTFNEEKATDEGKIIDCRMTCEKLGLTLIYDSPYKTAPSS